MQHHHHQTSSLLPRFTWTLGSLGHIEKSPESEIPITSGKSFYPPHHDVLKESSTTSKLPVAFAACAKTISGDPVTDNLMLGPKIQNDLFEILIRFRFDKVSLAADKEDKPYHRLLWKETPETPSLSENYRMTRNTYGVTTI